MTLTEFLLPRIAEDEDFAKAAASASSREWLPRSYRVVTDDLLEVGELAVPTSAHVARHDPARVLADCEAKRRIVDTADRMILDADDPESEMSAKERFIAVSCAMAILRSLAAIYADHPDYRAEWKP